MTSSTKIRIALGAAVAAAVLAWLAFGVFGIHTAFIDKEVNEANPFAIETSSSAAASTSAPAATDADTASAPEAPNTEMADGDTDISGDTAMEEGTDADGAMEEGTDADDAMEDPAMEDTAETEQAPEPEPEPEEAAAAIPEIINLGTGSLIDHDHKGEGTVNVITNGEQTFLRFEDDFRVDNGPDLNVYLVRGVDATDDPGTFDDDFIDLGDLKGNIGAQNYELPQGIDIGEYDTVVIWCVRFGVAFNAADLAPA